MLSLLTGDVDTPLYVYSTPCVLQLPVLTCEAE